MNSIKVSMNSILKNKKQHKPKKDEHKKTKKQANKTLLRNTRKDRKKKVDKKNKGTKKKKRSKTKKGKWTKKEKGKKTATTKPMCKCTWAFSSIQKIELLHLAFFPFWWVYRENTWVLSLFFFFFFFIISKIPPNKLTNIPFVTRQKALSLHP